MKSRLLGCSLSLWLIIGASAQSEPATDQIVEKANSSIAVVLTGQMPEGPLSGVGSALVVKQNGVLLTAYHVIKSAHTVQVRFKNGETFDTVQLLGVDVRRDVAAIKIGAVGLPVLPMMKASEAKAGDAAVVVATAAALPWSASTGVISAYRLADEVPGAGNGYRLLQFTAPISPGSSGGVLMDAQGRGLGLIVGSLTSSVANAQNLNFAVPLENVLGLANAPATKTFASGATLNLPTNSNTPRIPPTNSTPGASHATPNAPEKSDILSPSKDRESLLRSIKTMFVNAEDANYFRSDQMKAALGRNKDFAALNIKIVDDIKVADTILKVGYTFAWDYPFELKHQNTSIVLLSGKGTGPFSGPAGAASVASQFVKLAKPYRSGASSKTP